MEKKLFYVVDDGDSSTTVPAMELEILLRHGFTEWDEKTTHDELPVFTVSPVYMTQEEFENMPEHKGE